MFGSLVHKLQTLSPLTSPTTSPTTSPKPKRKLMGFSKVSRRRKYPSWFRDETREVQSEPETEPADYETPKKKTSFFPGSLKKRLIYDGIQANGPEKRITPLRSRAAPNHLAPNHPAPNYLPANHLPPRNHLPANHLAPKRDCLYDVPSSVQFKPLNWGSEASRTLGRVEGLRQVSQSVSQYY